YSTLNTIVLGKYSSPTIVGNFAAADKMRLAVQGLYAPIQQAVFPRASQVVMQDGGIKKVIKVFGIPFIMFGLIISLSYLIFGNFAVRIYYGEEFALAGTLFSMMFPLPLIISIATVFTHWVLIAQGQNKIVGKIYTLFSLVHLCYVIPFVKEFDAYGMVYSVVLTQSLITLAMIACVIKSIKRSHE
ncbi:TPA: oligosaccharide flippase family protein, partial [Klebsiella pneumoniae]|nr:oligosaccharide flippase family protein [Klebsiella pneumoniae]